MSIQTRTTAIQDEIVRLYFQFQKDGVLSTPDGQPSVEIIDTDGVTILDSITPQREHEGVYFVDYYVPANLPLGSYYDRWTYQWTNVTGVVETTNIFSVHSLDTYINFISDATDLNVSDRVSQLMRDLTNDFIYEAQHIPVYREQGMRIQQEDQQKRIKHYYYFDISNTCTWASEGTVYYEASSGNRFTVFQDMEDTCSSSSSESQLNSSSSESSSSTSSNSSSSSENADWTPQITLTCVGNRNPPTSGTLTKVSGEGSDTLTYGAFTTKTSNYSTVYGFAYKEWNQEPRPIVYVNNRIVDDGWHVDYNGKIYFDTLMAPEDSVNVSYNFAYFSPEEIAGFLRAGLQMMNATPPASWKYRNLINAPWDWDAGIILYAAVLALKRLLFGLNFQEKRLIYGDPEQISVAMGNFQDLYKQYYELWNEIREDIKKQLPNISQYVTPEYTLPGGRSRWFRYLYKSGA